ncbi:MAG: hypothetical protein DI586_00390 [Micavibrio aeruginosavorus]|uniref:ResB-like domain-containing protein n=1 Tax=Micavibrio aeruginosavorus TaxID=349221 RepID=A0A2W5FR55_9BACT|nr:MAG: hypothetical protein DI586_00390 [Micavibrio aeruginosavorus]
MPVLIKLRQIAFRLSRSDILFWTLPLLMVLLVIGTIAQKELGIYAAQKAYFDSFITFIGPVPFPGAATLLIVLFVNMLMKFLLFSEWQMNKAGVILTHFGVLVLLAGGFTTALTTREAYMVIEEGQTTNRIEDYYQRVLQINKDGKTVLSIPHQDLKQGLKIENVDIPFKLMIDTYCFNCNIERRNSDLEGWKNAGQFMQLVPARTLPKNEENLTGIAFTISGTSEDGRYVTFDKFPKPPVFNIGAHEYKIEITRQPRELPFSLKLEKFSLATHPGSDTAKAYRSEVRVIDGQEEWKYAIEMNEPMRYKGYTLYQSSFDLSGNKAFTVLNVVENSGRLFPYIASAIMAAGLVLHMLIAGFGKRRTS